MPESVSVVAALAFDAQTASAVDAAPWLLRLMCLLALAIILPRLLLVLKCTVGLAASRRRVRIDLESPYYRYILSGSDAPAVRTTVIVDSTDSVDGLPAHWHDFKAKLKTAEHPASETSTCWPTVPGTAQRVKFSPPLNPRSSTACFLPSTRPPLQRWRSTGP